MAVGGLDPEIGVLNSWVEEGRWCPRVGELNRQAGWAQVLVWGAVVSRTLIESRLSQIFMRGAAAVPRWSASRRLAVKRGDGVSNGVSRRALWSASPR